MKRALKIAALSFIAILLWAVLFEYKTCACGDKLSIADRAVSWVSAKARQLVSH